eukprot:scaffold117826_cov39-Phaeocystis_antarctica.AAC.1
MKTARPAPEPHPFNRQAGRACHLLDRLHSAAHKAKEWGATLYLLLLACPIRHFQESVVYCSCACQTRPVPSAP